jgi:hypothetical protein
VTTVLFFEFTPQLLRDAMLTGEPFCFEFENRQGRCELEGRPDGDRWTIAFRFDDDPWRSRGGFTDEDFVRAFAKVFTQVLARD